jgi:hypothetical protein
MQAAFTRELQPGFRASEVLLGLTMSQAAVLARPILSIALPRLRRAR